MLDAKELAKALQGAGKFTDLLEQFLLSSYGECADLRYQRARYASALARCLNAFPDLKKLGIGRAPGRVNLIGEHTDYNGLPVLPMAIERDTVVLFSPRKDRRVNLVNTSFYFPPRSFDISRRIRPYAYGNWGNYAKAAAQALQEVSHGQLCGMDACVMGDVPVGSGLSSSSSLVVAIAVALAATNDIYVHPVDFAELLGRGESSYTGTEDGGMDHAVSLLASPGKPLKIDFFPLNVYEVPFPQDYSFVVCNSLIAAEKSGAVRNAYNRRVIECRLGVALLREILKDVIGTERDLTYLGGLRHISPRKLSSAIDSLPDAALSLRQVAKLAGIPVSRIRGSALRLGNGETLTEPREGFKIKQRVRHVLTEGRRVEQAVSAIERGDMKSFGRLLNESHESCATDYEVSTPELDALVEMCREEGALGARLTGAGFGGCAISLVHDRDAADLMSAVIARYYHDYLPRERKESPISIISLEDAIFACKPCGGAATLM
ncbi:MAG: galactokinase [Armatimonadetes bacterium]|nr:galactokinase [Armatimonadota bacterium]